MIIDLKTFVAREKPYWDELEAALGVVGGRLNNTLTLPAAKRLFYLYQRASSDLVQVKTFAADQTLQGYLEGLVSRAYCEVHETRSHHRFRPLHWLAVVFPRTVRRHYRALALAVAVTLVGALFGGGALAADERAKEIMIPPWAHLHMDPADRVAEEEAKGAYQGGGASGTAFYFTHNTKVSIATMALGFSFGLGTLVMLFYNGVLLGAVAADYVLARQTVFLTAWLLPHGSVEIPAILLAGQAGLVLAAAVIGWGSRHTVRERMRRASADIVTLIGGVALLLAWAGIIESLFSQVHEPLLPYWMKIAFGGVQLAALAAYLSLAGRRGEATAAAAWEPTA